MNGDELRIGVIGAGGRGTLAALAHRPEQNVRLVAGCDVSPRALEKFKEKYGHDVFVTDDYRRLLERSDIHAVFVTSPDYLHEEHAVAALSAGKAVYLEKPMAITIAGCDRILRAAKRHSARLYLGHNMRHCNGVRKMKELIDAGAIGEVKGAWCRHFLSAGGDAFFKDWHSERRNVTGLLLQKAAHDIDVMHWLCGGYSRLVTALGRLMVYGQVADRRRAEEPYKMSWDRTTWPPLTQKKLSPVIDVEDMSMMLMELDNGVLCSYQQCHFTPDGWRNYTIIGTEGRIENFGDIGGPCVIRLWNRRSYYKGEGDVDFPIDSEEGTHGGADPSIVNEFIEYVRHGGAVATSPVAARFAVAAGYQATMSLRSGGRPRVVPALPRTLRAHFEGVF